MRAFPSAVLPDVLHDHRRAAAIVQRNEVELNTPMLQILNYTLRRGIAPKPCARITDECPTRISIAVFGLVQTSRCRSGDTARNCFLAATTRGCGAERSSGIRIRCAFLCSELLP